MCDIYNKKHIIKFNCDYLPDNFDKWIVCDKNNNYANLLKIDDKIIFTETTIYGGIKTNEKYIEINGMPVIIESLIHDFKVEIGGMDYVFEKGCLYIPVCFGFHMFKLFINEGVKLYREPITNLNDNEFYGLLFNHPIIFDKIKILNKKSNARLFMRWGLSGIIYKKIMTFENDSKINKHFYVDNAVVELNEFYIEFPKKEYINLIDKHIKKGVIEILKDPYHYFHHNLNVSIYDYKQMREKMKNSGIVEELMAYIFHPKNMNKWNDWGFSEHQDFVNFINK
jgi:hypothetical protein